MKRKLVFVCLCACVAFLMVSCDNQKNTSEVQRLQAVNDSLKLEHDKTSTELNDMLSLVNEVEDNFQKIKAAENYLTVQSAKGGELNPTTRERISADMKLLAETLAKNKEQLAKLQSQLKSSKLDTSELQKTVARLNSEMDEKATMIASLQEELAKKDIRIAELDEVVTTLAAKTAAQDEVINVQDKELNTAYYCFGTSKELKEQKILSGGGLTSVKTMEGEFNKDYFTRTDIRTFKSLALHAKKATLRSNHPKGSYEFVKDNNGEYTFKILDQQNFWSIGNYLVIEVGL